MKGSLALLFRKPCFLLLALPACTRYAPLALPNTPPLASSTAELRQGVPPDRPLRIAEVAMLAVLNSPDLAAMRSQRGVSQAQVLQAGVLANPTLSGGILPLLAGPAAPNGAFSSSTPAWPVSLTYDVRSLVTRGSRRREASAAARSLDATLLWQAWQTIAQARLLCADIIEGDRLLVLLRLVRGIVGDRAAASRLAESRGDLTLASVAPDLAALQAARGAAYDQERVQLGRRHQLAALLGLSPDATLTLTPTPDLPEIDAEAVRRMLPSLADRRPDLAALRFGYQAEDARLRTAILSQFPNLTVGITGGSDNSNVRNIGPQITVDLPIFDHNQGQIAVEQATRERLRAEYRARLSAAAGQVPAMLAELALARRQLAALRRDQPEVARTARVAEAAVAAGNLDERTALGLVLTRTTKEQEIVTLEQAVLELRVAIATLCGLGLPPLAVQANRP